MEVLSGGRRERSQSAYDGTMHDGESCRMAQKKTVRAEEACRVNLWGKLVGAEELPDDWATTETVTRETSRYMLGVSSGLKKENKD